MDRIQEIADAHGLMIIEDAAQAVGSEYRGTRSGSFGRIACFSMHPLKNLNACGDSGFLTTNDAAIAQHVRRLRSHGLSDRATVEEWGYVSRMDTLQAAIIGFRLSRLSSVTERRRANALYYQEHLKHERLFIPPCGQEEWNTFHTFVIQVDERDGLQQYLQQQGIKTAIHYPVPIHLQPAAANLHYGYGDFPKTEEQAKRILTLPVNQFLSHAEQDRIIKKIYQFFQKEA